MNLSLQALLMSLLLSRIKSQLWIMKEIQFKFLLKLRQKLEIQSVLSEDLLANNKLYISISKNSSLKIKNLCSKRILSLIMNLIRNIVSMKKIKKQLYWSRIGCVNQLAKYFSKEPQLTSLFKCSKNFYIKNKVKKLIFMKAFNYMVWVVCLLLLNYKNEQTRTQFLFKTLYLRLRKNINQMT